MRLLLIEIGLLDKNGQYAEIKVTKNRGIEQIKDDAIGQEGEVLSKTLTSSTTLAASANLSTLLSLNGDNQGSIALGHNQVFHV